MNTTKQFFGPLICVTFSWLAFRWAVGLIGVAQDCTSLEISPLPHSWPLYFLGGCGMFLLGILPLVVFCSFVHTGWRWFRTPEGRA